MSDKNKTNNNTPRSSTDTDTKIQQYKDRDQKHNK